MCLSVCDAVHCGAQGRCIGVESCTVINKKLQLPPAPDPYRGFALDPTGVLQPPLQSADPFANSKYAMDTAVVYSMEYV